MSKATSTSARRVLRVLKILKGHSLRGLSNGDVAKALGESPVNVTRALQALAEEGMVTQLDTGRWAHSVALLQIAQAHANEMAGAQDRIMELNRRILTGSQN